MTEGAEDRFRQPCLLPQLFKHLSDNPIPAGPTIGQRRQIVVLISVAENPPKFIPGGFPLPQNVSQGFRQLHPHCTAPFRVCLLIMESLRIVRKQKSRRSRYQ